MRYFFVCCAIFAAVFTPQSSADEIIDIPAMVNAIYIAEGGERALKPFGILSVPCSGYRECRRVCYNTVRNNLRRWRRVGCPKTFIEFLGDRYCPEKLHPLNRNWKANVRRIYAARNSRK